MHAKSTARQDSHHECSICCEHFGMEEQVLLSCSHVFHKQCIISFERYARLQPVLISILPAAVTAAFESIASWKHMSVCNAAYF